MDKPLWEWVWERIPELTRERDKDGHLQGLIRVLAEGLTGVRKDIEDFVTLIDVDTCPVEMLPGLAGLLGFDFPYDLPEEQQRNFIRSTVGLYKVKGTPLALKFAVTRLIGGGFSIEVVNEDRVAKTFTVQIRADEDQTLLSELENKIAYLVALYSPAGMIPTITVLYYTTEAVDGTGRFLDEHMSEEYTSWRTNIAGHRTNDTARTNDFGTLPLNI